MLNANPVIECLLLICCTATTLRVPSAGVRGSPNFRTTLSGCRSTSASLRSCLGSWLRAAVMLTSGLPSTAFSTARTKSSTGSTTKTRLETTGWDGCRATFQSLISLKIHIQSCHSKLLSFHYAGVLWKLRPHLLSAEPPPASNCGTLHPHPSPRVAHTHCSSPGAAALHE